MYKIIVASLLFSITFAQNIPNAGQILQQERQKELAPKIDESKIKLPKLKPSYKRGTIPSNIKTTVKKFVLEGDITIFSKPYLQDLLKPFLNKEVTIDELYDALDKIKDTYKSKGYFLIKVYYPVQDITSGIVRLKVIEGKLESIQIEGENLRTDKEYLRQIIEDNIKIGKPFTQKAFKNSIKLINFLPSVRVKAGIKKGQKKEYSKIIYNIEETDIFSSFISLDNTGSRYTGIYKMNVGGIFDNLSGKGDKLKLDITKAYSAGKMQLGALDYSLPLGVSGLRVGFKYSYLEYNLGDTLKSLNALGKANNYSLYSNLPLINEGVFNLKYNLSYDISKSLDYANDAVSNEKMISVLRNKLHMNYTDSLLKGAYSFLDFTYHKGSNDIEHKASYDADQSSSGAKTHGDFNKFTISGSRIQKTSNNHHLVLSLSSQYAMKNLDSSEKFQLGGMYGIRAYPGGEGSGDNGLKITIESRYKILEESLLGQVKLITFIDWGRISQYKDSENITLSSPNTYNLSGWGIGVTTSNTDGLNSSFTLTSRLGNNPAANTSNGNDSDGYKKDPRFWFSIRKSF